MAQRDRAAIHIQTLAIGTSGLEPGQRHRGKRLIDLEQIDVVDLHAGLLERTLGGRQGRFEHDHRIMADQRHVMHACQGREAQRFEATLVDHQQAGRAVADLAGVGRGNCTAFLKDLDRRDAGQAGIETDAFIDGVHLGRHRAVGHANRQRNDLVGKRA